MNVVVVSGNPRSPSRTSAAGRSVGERLALLTGGEEIEVVELASLAGELFAESRPGVDAALATVAAARAVVVATPVYKASYTGLLKSFLDLYAAGDLRGITTVGLVVAGQPGHLLAGEVHLKPVLAELGAITPTPVLALAQDQLAELDAVLDGWFATNGPALAAQLAPGADRRDTRSEVTA